MTRLAITLIVSLTLITSATAKEVAPALTPALKALIERTRVLTGKDGLLVKIPTPGLLSGRDFASESAASFARDLPKVVAHGDPLIVICSDRAYATKVIVLAFGLIRKGSLAKATVVCAVGRENDSKIRPVVEATGAKLFVEPAP